MQFAEEKRALVYLMLSPQILRSDVSGRARRTQFPCPSDWPARVTGVLEQKLPPIDLPRHMNMQHKVNILPVALPASLLASFADHCTRHRTLEENHEYLLERSYPSSISQDLGDRGGLRSRGKSV